MLNLFAVVVERDFVTIEWASFIAGLASNPILVVVTLLNIGVIVVNGATDAPNAIATVVSTRAMKPKPAIVMAAVCNFLGLLVVSLFTCRAASTPSTARSGSRWCTAFFCPRCWASFWVG